MPLQPLFGGGNRATRLGEALHGNTLTNNLVRPPISMKLLGLGGLET